MSQTFRIGTAAWGIPEACTSFFPSRGPLLERYSRRLNAVEINTSFYRDHKAMTYARWARSVPDDFRFAVKLNRRFTHEQRLTETSGLRETLAGISQLGAKFRVLLVQLPPSLDFDRRDATTFFEALRGLHSGRIALEARHEGWVCREAKRVLRANSIVEVIADPQVLPAPESKAEPLADFAYYRLHGSPVIYRSPYSDAAMDQWLARIQSHPAPESWCVFDNTVLGFATENALLATRRLGLLAPQSRQIAKQLAAA
jgi:uncharacterized protein YecE (DUF72 family)